MKILNFGSLNVDRVYGMPHFVRPGETISAQSYQLFAGGKGLNQSIALAKAGAEVWHAGKIGQDGVFLQELLAKNGVATDHLMVTDHPSGHAVIQVDSQGQNCIIIVGGANQEITHEDVDRVLESFEPGDLLLVQNEISSLEYLIRRAGERGMRVALNPSPISPELQKIDFSPVTWFILNEIEGEELSGARIPEEIGKSLLGRYPDATIVLTLGKRGVLCMNSEETVSHGIYDVPVVDTTAAGDTFTGYFLAAVLEGLPLHQCLKQASIASSIAIGRAGAAESIPLRAEMEEKKKIWEEA